MYIWWTSLIYIHHFEAAYKRPDVFAHPLAACRVLMHVRNTMHLQPEKANWKITVNWLIIIGYIFDNHNNGYIYIMDIWWISGWWLKNHLEKYESQWEGLSHILCKIENVWHHQPDTCGYLALIYTCLLQNSGNPFAVENVRNPIRYIDVSTIDPLLNSL